MQNKLGLPGSLIIVSLLLGHVQAKADLPPDFPVITVTALETNAVADGYVFLAVAANVPDIGYYVMILSNDATPVWYTNVAEEDEIYDFKVLPNGYLHYAPWIEGHSFAGGGDVTHVIMNESYEIVEHIFGGNGYVPESHDFQMLPNGHVLLFGYYRIQVDMSKYAVDGYPNAMLASAVVQELDAQRNAIFQWRSWDYNTLFDYFRGYENDPKNKAAVINGWHLNAVSLDTDGNILISTPQTGANLPASSGWVEKINRQTGETMWHLGGTSNQFTFVGVSEAEGIQAFSGHAVNRLPNGNLLIYDNGNNQATRPSKVYEFSLDEANKVATRVWSYVPATMISGNSRGNAQRLPNGNTFIGWGGGLGRPNPVCTEVTPAGQVVFEMKFANTNLESYRAFRFVYPPQFQAISASVTELSDGNSYDFANTGVSIEVLSGGGGYNQATLTREPYAPVYPLFPGKAPRALPVRVRLTENAISSLEVNLEFDEVSFAFANPADLTVHRRTQAGQGLFVPLTTSYNPVTRKLRATATLTSQAGQLGEFIFCYPDVAEVPYAPILNQVESYRGEQHVEVIAPQAAATGVTHHVNQELPISLSWSPKGFGRSYAVQIATNQNFGSLVVDVPFQTEAFFVWSNAAPETPYFYRVRTSNYGGDSDWSVGSFQTVSPLVAVTVPNGGEVWRRGLRYFIQWQDNLAENVRIDLLKAGTFITTIATNAPSTGAYRWEAAWNLVPGPDYAIRVSSATNSALYDLSDQIFSIVDVPVIDAGSVTRLEDGKVQFGFIAPGAGQATVWGTETFSPVNWQNLGMVPVVGTSGLFVDTNAPSFPSRFYRVTVP